MSVQASYSRLIGGAYEGLIVDQSPHEITSKACESIDGIDYGLAVSQGTEDDQCTLGGTAFIGISVRSVNRESDRGTSIARYEETDTVGILRTGLIWVRTANAVAPGTAATYTPATGAFGTGGTAIPNATYETSAAANELAIVRLGV